MRKQKQSLKRLQILSTATQIFASRGFAAASMDDIAAATPVSKATLYKYFNDKNDLFIQVICARCQALQDALNSSMRHSKDPLRELRLIAQHYWELIHSQEALNINSLLISQKRDFKDQAELYYQSGPQRMLQLLGSYLENIAPKLNLKIDDYYLAAVTLVNLVRGDTYYRALLGLTTSIPGKKRDEMIDHALHIFIKGYQV